MLMGFYLQESEERERGRRRTIVQLLGESMEMDGADRLRRPKTLKERIGLMGMSCCGANWGLSSSSAVRYDNDGYDGPQDQTLDSINVAQAPQEQPPGCAPATLGMNLAAALAAERLLRTVQESSNPGPSPARPSSDNLAEPKALFRVSLMRLLEETDDQDKKIEERGGGGVGSDSVCCVCMVRKKGTAFIPCGHTFCRVCSRELWLNRGNCPLCNRSIVEILDIF